MVDDRGEGFHDTADILAQTGNAKSEEDYRANHYATFVYVL